MFSDTAKKSAFSDAAAFCDAQEKVAPRHAHYHDKSTINDPAKTSAFSDTAKTSAFSDAPGFSDAQNNCAPQLATGMSRCRDVTAFSDDHKRDAPAGGYSLDKSVCRDAAAFSDAQINRTPL